MRFVVQQHDATTRHYDLRLEVNGVVRSWALPEGPSMNPADKRLAVEALERGKASFRLHGEKLRGAFTLVRTDAGSKPKWLLVKQRDDDADGEGPVRTRPESVVSGRTIDEVE